MDLNKKNQISEGIYSLPFFLNTPDFTEKIALIAHRTSLSSR